MMGELMVMTLKKCIVVVNSTGWVRFVLLNVCLTCLTAENEGRYVVPKYW